jgi:hypothetical protein
LQLALCRDKTQLCNLFTTIYNTTCGSVNTTLAYLSKIAIFLSISTNDSGAESKITALLQQRWDCTHTRPRHVSTHATGPPLQTVNGTPLNVATQLL